MHTQPDRVVVTGASGQLGAHLANRLLEEGFAVRVVLRPGSSHPLLHENDVEIIRGNFFEHETARTAVSGCSTVFHVAGVVSYARSTDASAYAVNADGTATLLRASAESGVETFVLTSSTMAVGSSPGEPPANEDAPFPDTLRDIPYADSKRLAERYTLSAGLGAMRTVSLCPSTLIGPGDKLGTFTKLFAAARRGRLRFAPPGGFGFVEVSDAVEGHMLALRRGVSGRRYILNTANAPFRDIFAAINAAVGRSMQPWTLPALPVNALHRAAKLAVDVGLPLDTAYRGLYVASAFRYYDSTRARAELGWSPAYDLEAATLRASQGS